MPRENALVAVVSILVVSALLSSIIDNIPYVATMSPLVADLAGGIDIPVHADALWWSLTSDAHFGGNLTAVGAIVTITIVVAAPYLWLRYFVFS